MSFRYNRRNPCPVCNSTKYQCMPAQGNGVLCFNTLMELAPEGWQTISELKNGMGCLVVPIEDHIAFQEGQEQKWRQEQEARQKKGNSSSKEEYQGLSLLDRHYNYRHIKERMGESPLKGLCEAYLINERGLTATEISKLGLYPWDNTIPIRVDSMTPGANATGTRVINKGLCIPAYNYRGCQIGGQLIPLARITRTSFTGPKYYMITSNTGKNADQDRPTTNLEDGALPLFHIRDWDIKAKEIDTLLLCEGALKPFIIMAFLWRHGYKNIAVIGAHANYFGEKQLQSFLTETYTNLKQVILMPDAGAVINTSNIPQANFRTLEIVQSCGHQPQVGWWGQIHKQTKDGISLNNDYDELLQRNLDEDPFRLFSLISKDKFFDLHSSAAKKKIDPSYCFAPAPQFGTASKESKKNRPSGRGFRIVTPYDNLPDESEWVTQQELEAVYTDPKRSKYIVNRSPVGIGKTHSAGQLDLVKLAPLFESHGLEDEEWQIVLMTADPSNVMTETLKDKPIIRGRDNGRKLTVVGNETHYRRTDDPGENDIPGNCVRVNLINLLSAYELPNGADQVCSGCPKRQQCFAGGSHINYQAQRREALEHYFYITHPQAAPLPEKKTFLILDEGSQLLQPITRSFNFSNFRQDIEKLRRINADRGINLNDLFIQVHDFLFALEEYLTKNRKRYPTYSINELRPFIKRLPVLEEEFIDLIFKADLSALQRDKDFQALNKADAKYLNKAKAKDYTDNLYDDIKNNNTSPWLKHLLKIRRGFEYDNSNNETDLSNKVTCKAIVKNRDEDGCDIILQIVTPNHQLLEYINHENIVRVIILDATASYTKMRQYFPDCEFIAVKPEKRPAKLNFNQVIGLGLSGNYRSKKRQERINEVKKQIYEKHVAMGHQIFTMTHKALSEEGDGVFYRDSRGRNCFKDNQVLIIDGCPLPNLLAKADEYYLLTGEQIDIEEKERIWIPYGYYQDNDDLSKYWGRDLDLTTNHGFNQFYYEEVLSELHQVIGRLRAAIRTDEELYVYFLSDYPVPWETDLLWADEMIGEKNNEEEVLDALQTMNKLEERITLRVVCERTGLTKKQVEYTNTWSNRKEILKPQEIEVMKNPPEEMDEGLKEALAIKCDRQRDETVGLDRDYYSSIREMFMIDSENNTHSLVKVMDELKALLNRRHAIKHKALTSCFYETDDMAFTRPDINYKPLDLLWEKLIESSDSKELGTTFDEGVLNNIREQASLFNIYIEHLPPYISLKNYDFKKHFSFIVRDGVSTYTHRSTKSYVQYLYQNLDLEGWTDVPIDVLSSNVNPDLKSSEIISNSKNLKPESKEGKK